MAVEIEPFPTDFPNKGKYRVWSSSHNLLDEYSDVPTYPGQMPIGFPQDASNFECHMGGYVRIV